MTQADSLLDEEELDFLLHQADVQTAEDLFDPTDSDTAKVTIRGDLDNISLADIFQTLSISKMRGILKVFNPLETRLVYFDQGMVRLMNANRKGNRRIGQRLVRCGVLTTAQLRQALLTQKKGDCPLGETLIELGFLTEDELTAVLNNQLEEDLHNIFIWSSGQFEFYKNKPDNEEILEEITRTPGFEVNGILLEAARRRDEWSQILENIGSVHAIPVFPDGIEFPEMAGSALAVCEAIDNFSTVSDLAETTMLGLFNCAKAVCDLKRDGLVELADPKLTIDLALDATRKQDTKRALQLCQNLQQHASELDFELCERLASVLEACREPRLSANILLDCAKALSDPHARIGIARRALGVDRHAVQVMEFIRKELRDANRTSDPEYLEILEKLCEALSSEGEDDAALEVFGELESLTSDISTLLGRKAKLLQRVGREDEALEALLDLRPVFEQSGDNARLMRLYEQILKLDPSQKDIARAMRVLKIGKTRSRLYKIYTVSGIALVIFGAIYAWQWSTNEERVQGAAQQIHASLDARKVSEARGLLASAKETLGPHETWATLEKEINDVVIKLNATEIAKRDRKHLNALNGVADELQRGNLEKAITLYKNLLAQPNAVKMVRRMAPGQLRRITQKLEKMLESLRDGMPEPPAPLARYEALTAADQILDKKVSIDTELARTMLVVAENNTVRELWPAKDLSSAKSMALEIQAIAQTVTNRSQQYKTLLRKIEKNRRLDPVFRKAQKAEEENRFDTAETLYRRLLAEYGSNENLAPGFRDRVTKYSTINRYLKLLEKAVERSDFKDARSYYSLLQQNFKDYTWGTMIKLPLRVITTPAGAEVWMNGHQVGHSPITLRYRPADKNWIKIHSEGFASKQSTVTGDSIGLVRTILNREPLWSLATKGAVDRPLVSNDSGITFLVDRTGSVSAWDMRKRKQLWRVATGDLSGLLTRPVLYRNLVLIASLDGPLRAFDQVTGKAVWSLDDLPSESTPVAHDGVLALATDQELVLLDLRKRTVRQRLELTSRTQQDLLRVDGSVLVTQDNGTLRLIDLRTGRDVWTPVQLDRGLVCQPLVVGVTAITATDEGRVFAFDLRNGNRIWERTGLGELQWQPASDGRTVFVAAQPTPESPATVHGLNLRTGTPRGKFVAPEEELWSTHPTVLQGKVLVGARSGIFRVLDPETLELEFHIQGKGSASARPTATAAGEVLFAFASKQTQVHKKLR